ncbi:hypothetical protein ACLB2K_019911 [Fragaria x ananassa]
MTEQTSCNGLEMEADDLDDLDEICQHLLKSFGIAKCWKDNEAAYPVLLKLAKEALVCTSDWLKSDPPNLYKDPSDDEVAIYAELEEIEKENGFNQGQEAATTPIELTGSSG